LLDYEPPENSSEQNDEHCGHLKVMNCSLSKQLLASIKGCWFSQFLNRELSVQDPLWQSMGVWNLRRTDKVVFMLF